MDHAKRITIAKRLCDRFVDHYSDDVIIGGVYGSTARATDTEWSDLEMLFVVQDTCTAQGRHFLYQGMPVCYSALKQSALENLLSQPVLKGDMGWPFWMGVLSVLKVLYGDQSQVIKWLDLGRAVPDELFKQGLEKELPGLVSESYGRIFSCKERGNNEDWYCAVLEVLFEMRDALCLLNKSWVTHDYYQGLVDTFEFPHLPKRYKELVPALWHVQHIDTAMRSAKELVGQFYELLSEHGIQTAGFTGESEIQL